MRERSVDCGARVHLGSYLGVSAPGKLDTSKGAVDSNAAFRSGLYQAGTAPSFVSMVRISGVLGEIRSRESFPRASSGVLPASFPMLGGILLGYCFGAGRIASPGTRVVLLRFRQLGNAYKSLERFDVLL